MANYTTLSSDKSKKVLLIWWVCSMLGAFPLYYWYVGRRAGLIRFCTMNFFWMGGFVDLIKILNGSFRDNVGAPLRN